MSLFAAYRRRVGKGDFSEKARGLIPPCLLDSTPQYRVNARENELKSAARNFTQAISKGLFTQRCYQRDVCHRVLWQTCFVTTKQDVAGCIGPLQVTGQRDADYRCDIAPVERVTLRHNDRTAVSRLRTAGLLEIRPPDFGLLNYHSTRRNTRRAAR